MVASLPDGYQHDVGERGPNLSAGQRQLVALARAELADPDILLLDRATAALDLASEATVNAATARCPHGHDDRGRPPADDRGARRPDHRDGPRPVAETGSHAELLERDGVYAALWAAFVGETEYAA